MAIIGTGASTIQFLPIVQRVGRDVTLFQRTPPWVFPHRNRPTLRIERAAYRLVPAHSALLSGPHLLDGRAAAGHHAHPQQPDAQAHGGLGRRILARQVKDPELRAKVTPDLHAGMQAPTAVERLLPALQRPNVSVETEKILEFAPEGVVTADGGCTRSTPSSTGPGSASPTTRWPGRSSVPTAAR